MKSAIEMRPSMQNQTRQQLTLFIRKNHETIEAVRRRFNPHQHEIISAHVTLCREDEISAIDEVLKNIRSLDFVDPLRIVFDQVERFEDGKGVWLPASEENEHFQELRAKVLKGLVNPLRKPRPHVTLMHPRNSTCTDSIFGQIKKYELPTDLSFNKISLIRQQSGGQWGIVDEFRISNGCSRSV